MEASAAAGTAEEGWQVEAAAGGVGQQAGWWLPGTWAPAADAGGEEVQQPAVAHVGGGGGGRAPLAPSEVPQRSPERLCGKEALPQLHRCSGRP